MSETGSLIHSVSSDAEILFFPFEKEITAEMSLTSSDLLSTRELSVRNDILELNTSKTKAGVGTFNLVLGSNKNYKKLIHPGCWCLIFVSDQRVLGDELQKKNYATTQESGFKMLGIVRTVRRQEILSPETGTKIIRYSIAGEDFQSLFNVPIYLNRNLTSIGGKTDPGAVRTVGLAALGLSDLYGKRSPDAIVKLLIENLVGSAGYTSERKRGVTKLSKGKTGIPVQIPRAVSKKILGESPFDTEFASTLTLLIQSNLLGGAEFQPDIGGVVPAWSIIQQYVHRILNELYTEILPVKIAGEIRLVPCLILRAIPFSSKRFHSSQILFKESINQIDPSTGKQIQVLAERFTIDNIGVSTPPPSEQISDAHFFVSKIINEAEIIGFDLGKSDKERFNFFFVTPSFANIQDDSAVANIIEQIAGKGFQNIADAASVARYGMRPYITQSNYQFTSQALTLNKIVKDLWENSYLYENGQVTIIGQPGHIPVGTNVMFAERGWIGHVEAVSHRFRVGPDGKKEYFTTLALSRLQKQNGDPIEAVETPDEDRKWERGVSTDQFYSKTEEKKEGALPSVPAGALDLVNKFKRFV